MKRKRSIGITVFGLLMLISSLLFLPYWSIRLIIGIPMAIYSMLTKPALDMPILSDPLSFVLGYMPALTGAVWFIAGFNVLRVKNWARLLIIYYSIFLSMASLIFMAWGMRDIVSSGMSYSPGDDLGFLFMIAAFIFLMLSSIFIIFFTRFKVKEQFKQ